MARHHERSCDCLKSELDVFGIPPTQNSIDQGWWSDTYPVGTLRDRTPVEFHIPGDGENYLDLANTFLYVRASIRKADDSAMTAVDHPGPVNNWLHSLFEEVTVHLGDKVVSEASNAYPYRAYLETLLSMRNDTQETQSTTSLFYKDTAGHMDSRTSEDGVGRNTGLVTRGAFTNLSEPVEMLGRLHSDILFQDRFLISNVPMKIKLTRSKDRFSLMAPAGAGEYMVRIHSAVLYYRSVAVKESIRLAQEKVLLTSPVKYPVTRVQCRYYSIATGMSSINLQDFYRGQMPTRIIIGCVDTDAFNGTFSKNPFNFQHKNLTEVSLHISDRTAPIKVLQPVHPNQNLLSYMSVFTGTGKWGKDEGCGFSRAEYPNGFCLYAWDLSADLSDTGEHFQLRRNTNIRIELKFNPALTQTTTLVAYAEFQNMIFVDANRNVTTDYDA